MAPNEASIKIAAWLSSLSFGQKKNRTEIYLVEDGCTGNVYKRKGSA